MLAEPGMPALLLPSARLYPALSLIADVNLELVPAPTCSGQSTATGQAVTLATAGVQATFLITARDQFYNERGIDEDSFYFNFINDEGSSATR